MSMSMSMSMPEMATEAKPCTEAGRGICAISNCSSIRGVAATGARGREGERKIGGGDASDERADMCRDSKRYSVSVLARLCLRRCHSH